MQPVGGHTLLLGGVGGDSHFIGITILRQALTLNGYRVCSIGIQNSLETFVRLAHRCNVVMISSLDGHAHYYMSTFPELMQRYQAHQPLFYLGGNLTIGDAVGYGPYFRDLGFHRVFEKFVDVNTLLGHLAQDLHSVAPLGEEVALPAGTLSPESLFAGPTRALPIVTSLADQALEPPEFARTRAEVLQHWPTGSRVIDLEANAEFLKQQPSFAVAQAQVRAGRQPMLLQPRIGFALVREQVDAFRLFKHMGIRVLSYQVDSLTRNHNFAGAEEALRDSQRAKQSTLNGFPLINHGALVLRRIIGALKMPMQTRHSCRDARLLAEISFAGGVTSFEGGPICYNVPYYRDYSLTESVQNWQYIDRLAGWYYERYGIVLDREFFGALTGTLVPPCLAIVSNILEAILAVQQGIKSISLGYAEQGHRIQDIAAMRMMATLTREALTNLGYGEVQINTVFHQYMAAFPELRSQAEHLIYHSAITAALSGATRVIVKTPVEALRIPTVADNLQGVSLAMRAMTSAADVLVDEQRVAEESGWIRREVEAILESVIMCGRGSVANGVVNAFAQGLLDIPFAPSIYNKGATITVRDGEGAVRFLSAGHLAFDHELKEYHAEKVWERRRKENLTSTKQDYLLIEQDVSRIARGEYQGWPLFA
jgi:methylaspartate mutase epsilon subunit